MAEIGDAISRSPVPVDVFIEGRAISAGAYIALCANRIVMSPEAVMGASQPVVTDGTPAPEKTKAAFGRCSEGWRKHGPSNAGLSWIP